MIGWCKLMICDVVLRDEEPLGKGVKEGEVDGRFATEML